MAGMASGVGALNCLVKTFCLYKTLTLVRALANLGRPLRDIANLMTTAQKRRVREVANCSKRQFAGSRTSRLDALLLRARRWCEEEPGRRAVLARALGWRINEVSTYLAERPSRRPCAEKALQLHEWTLTLCAAARPAKTERPEKPTQRPSRRRSPADRSDAMSALRNLINS